MKDSREQIYEQLRVPKAVMKMAVPTIISQIISMVYNMADTFYIGQLGDPSQVAAVSIAAPAALLLTALANLFGIGGSGALSRALGSGESDKAAKITSFSVYASAMAAIVVSLVFFLTSGGLLTLMGADASTLEFTRKYIFWVIVLGALPNLLSLVLSHFTRADGAPKYAGYVLSAGGILNLILDPILIFDWGCGLGLSGAAIATFISNLFTLAAFIIYYVRKRGSTVVSFRPSDFTLKKEVSLDVTGTGLPSALQTLLASVSNMFLNNFAGAYGSNVVASIGIVKKLDQVPMSITIGFAQGIVPLVGYSYGKKNIKKTADIIRYTGIVTVVVSLVFTAVYELFPGSLISLFINDAATIATGIPFLRIMCISTPLMAVAFIMMTSLQASGKKTQSTILSVMRKGALDIPLMFILNAAFPLIGLAFVQPVAEGLAMIAALVFYRKFFVRSSDSAL